jgi:hypothetical protein
MTLSKKNYRNIAAIFAMYDSKGKIINAFANYAKADNIKFDRERFMTYIAEYHAKTHGFPKRKMVSIGGKRFKI